MEGEPCDFFHCWSILLQQATARYLLRIDWTWTWFPDRKLPTICRHKPVTRHDASLAKIWTCMNWSSTETSWQVESWCHFHFHINKKYRENTSLFSYTLLCKIEHNKHTQTWSHINKKYRESTFLFSYTLLCKIAKSWEPVVQWSLEPCFEAYMGTCGAVDKGADL